MMGRMDGARLDHVPGRTGARPSGTGTRREEPAARIAREAGRPGRGRRMAIELRPAAEPLSAEELRRREEELERLIIKAACRRAARLAEELGGLDPADARTPAEA
jgi:hypothetical protein